MRNDMKCKGPNCKSDGTTPHSSECRFEYAANVASGVKGYTMQKENSHLAVLEELALIESVLKGYPASMARGDALRAVASVRAAIALMRGQSEPVAWVTPEWMARLVRRDPIIERSVMFLPISRARTHDRTIALYAALPKQETAE